LSPDWPIYRNRRSLYSPVARAHGNAAEIPRVLDTRTECYHAGEILAFSRHTCCG